MTTKCAGLNCTSTDDTNHSPECRAEHAAAVAGGRFVKDGGARDELITALNIARQFVPNGTEAAERVDAAISSALSIPSAPAVDAVGDFQQLTEKRAQAIAASVEQNYGDTLRLAVDVAFCTAPAVDGARDEREAFEAWAITKNFDVSTMSPGSHDDYAYLATEFAWKSWQARAALSARASEAAAGEPVAVGFRTRQPGFAWVPWLTDDQETIRRTIQDAIKHGAEGEALYTTPPAAKLSTETVDKTVHNLTTELVCEIGARHSTALRGNAGSWDFAFPGYTDLYGFALDLIETIGSDGATASDKESA